MANTSKSTRKAPAKRAASTSSGSGKSGTRGTRSRANVSSGNGSREDDIDQTRNVTSATAKRRTAQEENLNYEDDYRDSRYRGMSNDNEEGDLETSRRRSRPYEHLQNRGRDAFDDDRSYRRNIEQGVRDDHWRTYDVNDDQMLMRDRRMEDRNWASDRRRSFSDFDHRGGNGNDRRFRQGIDERSYDDRDRGFYQEADYDRNWTSRRDRGMSDYEDDRRRSSYSDQGSHNQGVFQRNDDRNYTRQGFDDEWSGNRNPGRSGYEEYREYGPNRGYDQVGDRHGRNGDHYGGSERSERNWRSGRQGLSNDDDSRGYRSTQGFDDDMNWSSRGNQERNQFGEERRAGGNRGDYDSNWGSDQRRSMADADDDWRSGRSGQSERFSWDRNDDGRNRRNRF